MTFKKFFMITIYFWDKNIAKCFIKFGKIKIVNPFTRGKWMKHTSKLRDVAVTLYRAIDVDGLTLDLRLRKKRDTQAVYTFLKRLHKQFGAPRVLVTDKAPFIGSTFKKL